MRLYLVITLFQFQIIANRKATNMKNEKNECHNACKPLLAVVPSYDEIETASIDYRDKSDNENANEETMMIVVHWYDKQEDFQAGVKWFIENYC